MSKDNMVPQNAPSGTNPLNGPGGQISPEMLKMIAALQEQKMKEMPKYKRIFMQFMQKTMPYFQSMVGHLDRFINFVTKPTDKDRNDVVQAARAPILFGTYVIIIFFGFGGLWTSLAPLDSAAHAIGTVMSSTNKKTLQHPRGGTIKAIHVQQGDHVKAGQPIVELEETEFKTTHDSLLSQYRISKASENRLIAERDNLPNIDFAPDLLKDAEQPEVTKILESQRNLFKARREFNANYEKSTQQKIEQTKKTIEGLRERKVSAQKLYDVMGERLSGAKALFAKGFQTKAALLELETKYADAKTQSLNMDTEIIKAEQEISLTEIQLMQQKSDSLTKVTTELKDVQTQVADIKEKFTLAKESLDRAVIVSPVDGIVNVINVTTVGGVVSPGFPVAEVSPEKDVLIVEAKISPKNIAYVHPGLKAKMNFTAFKGRTTPTFIGNVISVSPDIVNEKQPVPGQEAAYYIAHVEIDMEEFNKEAKRLNLVLLPGMGVDVNIVTGTRTLLRYILDPITDNMFRAFKEK
jgi:HlyD family secretion protein